MIRLTLVVPALVLVHALGAFAPAPAAASPTVELTVTHVADDRFRVEVTAPDGTGGIDISWRPGEGAVDGTADFVSNVVFIANDGSESSAVYEGEGHWRPAAGPDAPWRAYRYTLTAAHDQAGWDIGKEEIAYRFDDAFYFVGDSVLAVPLGWVDRDFEVRFVLPAGWTVVGPWTPAGERSFAVHGLHDLLRNIFVVGPGLDPETLEIGGLRVTLLTEEAFDEARPAFAEVLAASLSRYAEIFGGMPMDRYLVVFGSDTMNDGGAFAQSFGQRLPAPFRPHETLMWARTLAHETLHAWLGITIRPVPHAELQWFTEGGADYLTMKTLYRTGLVPAADVLFMLEGQVRRFFLGRVMGGPVDLREAGQTKQQHRTLIYGAGAIFHLLLDARLAAENGPGAYERVLRALYETDDREYDFARMMAALDSASDGAASEIFDVLNGPFDPFAMLERLGEAGLTAAAYGPDEIMIRFAANGCAGGREARCMPDYLGR